MKTTYMKPEMVVVVLQHRTTLMQTSVQSNVGIKSCGASSNNEGGIIRTKESTNIWDEEW